ncbi:MAG: hypothetical protein LBS07_02875 [Prevotellaceae bacterium]|jgi:hypothetical protein|nr:hypothetical protein [Prevotellaceae bacterium]
MKIHLGLWLLAALLLLSSCNAGEGLGGSSSLEGYVYNIIHYDDNLSFGTDTIPAAKEDVFLIFGGDAAAYFGDDVEADNKGLFRFDYLRTGNYIVYAYSELASGKKEAVYKEVKIGKGYNRTDTLFIHTGKAYGTAIIKGEVHTTYHHNGSYRGEGRGTGMRAYIKHAGEDAYFNDVRVVDGIFFFQKLLPGAYEVAVETEDKTTEAVSLIIKPVTITETGIIYKIEEVFEVNTSV